MKRRVIQVGDGGLARKPRKPKRIRLPRILVPKLPVVDLLITSKKVTASTKRIKMTPKQKADFAQMAKEMKATPNLPGWP